MAQPRRRRQTKHRGNAAGVVEARGRTGRKPTAGEKQGRAAGARANRFDRPPSWRGAFIRGMAAAIVLLLIGILLLKKPSQAIAIFPIVLILYVLMSYYTDLWIYRRRNRSKTGHSASKPASKAGAGGRGG